MPADDGELEVNLLEFLLKSFSFDRCASVGGTEYALFHRTETESEMQFRPRLVTLRVIVPRAWVVYDLAADLLFVARDGGTPGARATGQALEEAAEKSEFQEQGVRWRKTTLQRGSVVYAPTELSESLLAPGGRAELGLT
ncbi:MAG: hypothetical protein L3K19_05180 [Thermoplasmata archaeon]|nr:hypothetical protein [Thermoplasmata archaeon]